jgi:DNA-binding transcriptional LysR family regulator
MELRQLEIVTAIAEAGTVTGAAARLHVAQPSVSAQLKALEDELGATLFDRLPRGVRLTEAGHIVLRHARRVFQELDEMANDLDELAGLRRGHLAIGTMPTLTASLIPTVVKAFRDRFPGVSLTLLEARSRDLLAALEAHQIHVAMLTSLEQVPLIEIETLWEEELVVIVPPDDPLADQQRVELTELAERDFVLLDVGFGLRTIFLTACRRAGFTPRVAMELESIQAIKSLVESGLGISVVPRSTVALEERAGLLRVLPLAAPRLRRPVQIARIEGEPTRAVQAFVDLCRQVVREAVARHWGAAVPGNAG